MLCLVVDDDQLNLNLMQAILESKGATVNTALSGIEALELCAKKVYDVIILDICMPEMSGIEVHDALRGAGVFSRIIFWTAFPKYLDIQPNADILHKPVNIDEVVKKVWKI